MIVLLILVLLVVYLIWYTAFRSSDLPPGPPKLPFIGNIWWLILQKIKKVRIAVALCYVAKRYGDIVHFQVGNKNIIYLQGFDAINEAFVSKADDFSSRPSRIQKDGEKIVNGIVMENGRPHAVLQNFIMKFLNSETARTEEKVLQEIGTASQLLKSEKSGLIDIGSLMSMMVTNIMYNVMFSKRFDYADDNLHRLMANLGAIFKSGSTIDATAILPKFLMKFVTTEKMKRAQQETVDAGQWVKNHVMEEIANHKATYNESKPRDFVDVYIKEQQNGSDIDIFTEERLFPVIKGLFIAGSEATAVSLNWMILYMQEYPELQQKCQREIREKCGEGTIRLSDKGTLSYLESTLMEIQRMSNTGETSLPHATDKETSLRGYRIPKDSIVLANLRSSNKDIRHWEEPDLFVPERFLQDKARKNPAFLPLGLGRRRCTGASLAGKEIFLIFTNLLQRFTFQREDQNVKHSFGSIDDRLTTTPLPYKTRVIVRQ